MASEIPPCPMGLPVGQNSNSETPATPPPALPPVLPAVPPVIPAIPEQALVAPLTGTVLQGRLHPFTLFFTIYHAIRSIFVPLVIILLFGRKEGEGFFYFWILLMIGLSLAYTIVRYFTFTYRIENGELITKHGILGRMERNIPLSRVQDIRLEQRLMHRLFRVVEVQIETAGGKGAEASLSVLSKSEAERLRAAIFTQRGAPALSAGGLAAEAVPTPVAEVVRQLNLRELALAGLTSNYIASALLILFIIWQQLNEILPEKTYERMMTALDDSLTRGMEQAGDVSWLLLIVGGCLFVLLGLLCSVVGSIVVFYGFTLTCGGDDLHRAYGLFTRRASSLPRRRIQVLKIEESWVRRLLGLATLRVDTAGSQAAQGPAGKSGRDAVLPIIWRKEIAGLLPVFFPDLDVSGDWRQVSRRAIRRGTVKGSAICLLLAGVTLLLQKSALGLWPLAFIPLVYFLNVLSYRYLGYRHGADYFWTRQGWLSRTTHIVPVRNVQAIVIRQTPLDRWHRVATVLVDTAGQAYTGGGPHIANVPQADALALARTLAQKAAQTRYRW